MFTKCLEILPTASLDSDASFTLTRPALDQEQTIVDKIAEPPAGIAQSDTGAFRAGEPLTLIDSKCRRYLVFPGPESRHDVGQGAVLGKDLLGATAGARIRTSKGQVVAAYRTTLEEYVLLMPRAAAVIPPKDIFFMIQWADVFLGATVAEAGMGSGGLTLGLLRAVGETGRVHTFELREDHANRAQKNVLAWREPLHPRLNITIGDIRERLGEVGKVDRVFLDLPDPNSTLDAIAPCIKPGGFVIAYAPTIRQIDSFVLAVLDHPDFAEPEVAEVMVRPWVADRQRLRPELRIVGHSGFVARARRRGERAPARVDSAPQESEISAPPEDDRD